MDIKRRTFLELSTCSGLAPALIGSGADPQAGNSQPASIENRFFRLSVDPRSGSFSAARRGERFLVNARAAATGATTFSLGDARYTRTGSSRRINDTTGAGEELVIRAADSRKEADLELRLTLYDGLDAFFAELAVANPSARPLPLSRLEPVRARMDELAALVWPGADKVLTNGYMYYDPGKVEDIIFTSRKDIESVWNLALHDTRSGNTLVIGSIDNTKADTKVAVGNEPLAVWDRTIQGLSLTVASILNRTFTLPPGASVASGKIMFHADSNAFNALEQFASTYAKSARVTLNPIVNGWCSWFYTHRNISEDEVLRNAEFIAKYLKPYGMTVVQIDDGFYRAFGDWEGNERFKHGMKWLADGIRALGLVPGLWLAPYVIDKDTEVAEKHPEYLVHGLDGEIHEIGGGKSYALDITHPGARRWLHDLFDTVANKWGYDFLKIDFVEWSLLAAPRYHDPSVSRAQAYRMGFETMRHAAGPKRHLLDCGPAQNTVGILDSVRIELDLAELTWEQYTGRFYANAPAAAKRYYFHGKTWINDADHLGLGWLTPSQAQAAATVIAMSGGTMISGDRLVDLEPGRLEVLRKVLPSFGVAARPIDLFRNEFPRIFALPVRRPFGEWLLVAVLNYDTKSPLIEQLRLLDFGLDSSKPYVAFEFWTQQFLGEFRDSLQLNVNPSSVQLISIREATPHPQVIGTSRHFTQGGLELDAVEWTGTQLNGTFNAEAATRNELFIRIPRGWHFPQEDTSAYVYTLPAYTAKILNPEVLRLLFRFDQSGKQPFSVRFEKAQA